MWQILSTPLLVVINILILYYILKKLLYKPLANFMENRSKNIQSQLEEAKARRQEADALHQQYMQQLDEVKQQTQQLLKDARAQAQQQMNSILENAKAQAGEILAKAQKEAQRQKELALQQARDEMAQLVLAAVSELLQRELDDETDQRLIKSFIESGIRG